MSYLLKSATRLNCLSLKLGRELSPRLVTLEPHLFTTLRPNIVSRRWSGHDVMRVQPSSYVWHHIKNWFNFYLILGLVPLYVLAAIINIRSNPELTEIPEGYEPRDYEYYKHPVQRWEARHLYNPMEMEHEMFMAYYEQQAERNIITKSKKRIEKVIRFHADHRGLYFQPFLGAEKVRMDREEGKGKSHLVQTATNKYYDRAFSKETKSIPVEGYKPSSE